MDEREMNAFLNMMMYGFGEALSQLVDIRLVNQQLAKALLTDKGKMFMQDVGIPVIEDTDLEIVVKKYRDAMKSKKITQRFEILELDKTHAKLDIGQCVFAPATKVFRESGMKVVPCPIVTLLLGIILRNAGLHGVISDFTYKPETNSTEFTIEFKEI
jgi:hypothetical protein